MLSAMTSTTVDGPDSVIWGASACARCSNWARRSSWSCHWACKAVTDWASCGQYSSGCRRRQGLLTQATLQITRATASVMVCQRAGGRTGPLPAWSAGAVVRHTSAPVPSTMASPSSAVCQCMPMYSAISRALVLASAPSTVALSGADW